MKVCAITATKNRHTCLERSVRMFLNQSNKDCVQLIYNNSCVTQRLNNNIPADRVILVNNCVSTVTGKAYTSLGEIYNDAIKHIPEDCDVVCFMDDDDCFLNNHIQCGIDGLKKGGKLAYKPQKSYFRTGRSVHLVENTMEPSIFVNKDHVLKHRFSEETTSQHLKWLQPLINEGQIFVDVQGTPTLIYVWGEDIHVFKTSGNANDPNNFKNYENFSQDIGDQIITPMADVLVNKYYRISSKI